MDQEISILVYLPYSRISCEFMKTPQVLEAIAFKHENETEHEIDTSILQSSANCTPTSIVVSKAQWSHY